MFDITTLQSLVGKTVRLYRGEAESIRGILLAAKSNYIVQLTEDSQVLYYYLPPLTSIEEDFRNPPFEIKKGIPQEVIEAESYEQLLKSLVNKRVRIDRIGKDSYTGLLRFAGTDYVVLQTKKETFVYYQLSEIKCIGIPENLHEHSQKDGNHSKIGTTSPLDQFHDAPNFSALLAKLRNTFVHVHFTCYEPISGILTEADQNQIALVHNKELVWISKATIASVTTTADTVFPVANQNARHVGNREVFCLRVQKRDKHKRKRFSAPPAVRIHPKKKSSKHQITLKTQYPFKQKGNSTQAVTIKLPGVSYPRWKR
ncbi:hypothetical protein [Brevibacillus laterosporus]|nr:hypothetical protein [Brevibacillus laterosporus]MDN9011631.1 hypothetical protein [Brevibacillus laterosporus]MDO0942631.1 hypothetical protein [Brevibacillus laterosporus]